MSIKDEIQMRVKQLEEGVNQSIANHNALLGRLMEAKELLAKVESEAEADAKEVVGEVV